MENYSKELKVVKHLARKAGQAIMELYNKNVEVKFKAKDDPVTVADLTSNKIIIDGLKEFNYGILSEELRDDKLRLKKEKVWIIDPLDGTKGFIDKKSEFSVMIGLVYLGEVVLGVVYNPIEDILYYAVKGKGSFKQSGENIERIEVSNIDNTKKAKMLVSRHHGGKSEEIIFKKLDIKKLVPCGSAGIKISLIAEGENELNINTSPKTWEWDVCAADIILREAGGRLTDIKGNEFTYNKEDSRNMDGYVASNGLIHDKVIKELEFERKFVKSIKSVKSVKSESL